MIEKEGYVNGNEFQVEWRETLKISGREKTMFKYLPLDRLVGCLKRLILALNIF